MTLKMKIDNRERQLIKTFKLMSKVHHQLIQNVNYEILQLDIGDIIFEYNISPSNSDRIIIERKTAFDLLSSFQDTRYSEQKLRLLSEMNNTNSKAIYLIEDINSIKRSTYYNSTQQQEKLKTIYSAILSTLIRDNIFVLQSENIKSSALLILTMYHKINKFIQDPNTDSFSLARGGIKRTEHRFFNIRKSSSISQEDTFINMLCVIKGISDKRAKKIGEYFSFSLKKLIDTLSESPDTLQKARILGPKTNSYLLSVLQREHNTHH